MQTKQITVAILVIAGVYMLLFHSSPFPFSHDAIGLPPYHGIHALIGLVLLGAAAYFWKRK